jgi:peptidoglycan/xylan/chitin deacetylase (PgdA/CDA1 family)
MKEYTRNSYTKLLPEQSYITYINSGCLASVKHLLFLTVFTLSTLIIMTSSVLLLPLSRLISASAQTQNTCHCVIFRMDDLQDSWLDAGQIAPMNLFLQKEQKLTLAIVMNHIGKDPVIVNKIKEGAHDGLFELAIHGWDHVDYTGLSVSQQQNTTAMASQKMVRVFNTTSHIFVPPYDMFNSGTLEALDHNNITIISANLFGEEQFASQSQKIDSVVNTNETKTDSSSHSSSPLSPSKIMHIPAATSFKYYVNGTHIVKVPLDEILNSTEKNIEKFGYGVILIHPQDFVIRDSRGKYTQAIDPHEINDLSLLVDSVLGKGYRIASLSDVAAAASGSSGNNPDSPAQKESQNPGGLTSDDNDNNNFERQLANAAQSIMKAWLLPLAVTIVIAVVMFFILNMLKQHHNDLHL